MPMALGGLPLPDFARYPDIEELNIYNMQNKPHPKVHWCCRTVKRDKHIQIYVTEAEQSAILEKAKRAGVGVSVYLRKMLLEERMNILLTEEEREFFRELVNMSNDLHQLVKLARTKCIQDAIVLFESYRNQID